MVKINMGVSFLFTTLLSSCGLLIQPTNEEANRTIRPLIPVISCWKDQLKVGAYLNKSSEQIKISTVQELQKIYKDVAFVNSETQDELREQVFSIWAKRYGLDANTKKHILKKVLFPGTCEKNLFG